MPSNASLAWGTIVHSVGILSLLLGIIQVAFRRCVFPTQFLIEILVIFIVITVITKVTV